jgi:hypothetical protein
LYSRFFNARYSLVNISDITQNPPFFFAFYSCIQYTIFPLGPNFSFVSVGVHGDAAAAADSTADSGVGSDKGAGTIPSYGDFSESDRKILEETGTKQEFQAEV